jgi:radical SAM superfamily enzyme YgiQ (UPF0313 family)
LKRILLVSANQEKNPYPVAPIGLLFIANALKASGHEVAVLDLCFSEDVGADIKAKVQEVSPDLIGVSIRNVDNLTFPQTVSYLPVVKNIVDKIKAVTDTPIVLGGSAFSLFPEKILNYMDCNFGILGEGEEAMGELLASISQKRDDFSHVSNLVWRRNGNVVTNRLKYLQESLDRPLDYGFVDNARYMDRAGMGNVQTKRGCAFQCSYCTYPSIEGRKYRLRSPDVIVDEMLLLQDRHNVQHVFFVDDVFTAPEEHAAAVCEALIDKGVKMRWSCFASPWKVSRSLLELMKKAGCTHIEWGTDALSDKVLLKLRKPFKTEDAIRVSRECREVGIKSAHYIIWGAPGEDKSTLQEAFEAIKRLQGDAVIAMLGIRIYPGTELENTSVEDGIISKDDDLLEPRFYISRGILVKELIDAVSGFAKQNPQCVVPGLGIRSSEEMYAILRKHYREGPLWGYL